MISHVKVEPDSADVGADGADGVGAGRGQARRRALHEVGAVLRRTSATG